MSFHKMGRLLSFLKNSYRGKKQAKSVDGFQRDESLSGERAQVYVNPDTGKAVVTHRGTSGIQDVITDAKLLFAPSLYRKSKRYKHARHIQRQAEEKYGAENITTTGHSLGARLASDLGKQTSNVVVYNKPVTPYDIGRKSSPHETHIRTKYDPVSILAPVLDRRTKTHTIESDTPDPIGSHSTEQLAKYEGGPVVGTGVRKAFIPKYDWQVKNSEAARRHMAELRARRGKYYN